MMMRVKLVIISSSDGSTVSRLIRTRICSDSAERTAVAADVVHRAAEAVGGLGISGGRGDQQREAADQRRGAQPGLAINLHGSRPGYRRQCG